MQCAPTHTPPFSSLGVDRSGQPKASGAASGEGISSSFITEPRDLSLFICVVRRVSTFFWDHKWCRILYSLSHFSHPQNQWPAILDWFYWSSPLLTSFKGPQLPAFLLLLTCQGWLTERGLVLCEMVRGLVSQTVKTFALAAPHWTYMFLTQVILSFYRASGCHTHNPAVLLSPTSTHCAPSWCFLPPPTLFVIALFTYTVLQWSRCTCPLSNIWHLDISPGKCLCNSSNALLKLAQYSGSEACRGSSQVKLFQASVWCRRSSCHGHFG